jgi:hypothetical protein
MMINRPTFDVGQHVVDVVPVKDRHAEGQHDPAQKRRQVHQKRRDHEQKAVGIKRDDVLLGEQLQRIGETLAPEPAADIHQVDTKGDERAKHRRVTGEHTQVELQPAVQRVQHRRDGEQHHDRQQHALERSAVDITQHLRSPAALHPAQHAALPDLQADRHQKLKQEDEDQRAKQHQRVAGAGREAPAGEGLAVEPRAQRLPHRLGVLVLVDPLQKEEDHRSTSPIMMSKLA